jgi:hypothetical protein
MDAKLCARSLAKYVRTRRRLPFTEYGYIHERKTWASRRAKLSTLTDVSWLIQKV